MSDRDDFWRDSIKGDEPPMAHLFRPIGGVDAGVGFDANGSPVEDDAPSDVPFGPCPLPSASSPPPTSTP